MFYIVFRKQNFYFSTTSLLRQNYINKHLTDLNFIKLRTLF